MITPPSFALLLHTRALSSNTNTLEWMLIKRSEESMVYGSFVSVMWNLL